MEIKTIPERIKTDFETVHLPEIQRFIRQPFVTAGMGHSGRAHSPLEFAVLKADNPDVCGIIDFEFFAANFLAKFSAEYKT